MRQTLLCWILAGSVLTGCAIVPSASPHPAALEPITGLWRLPDQQGWIELTACAERSDELCGALVGFDGDPDSRDFSHPDLWSWGERICGSRVVQGAEYDAEGQVWRGAVYWRAEARVLHAELRQADSDTINVVLFEGADLEEGLSMAVSAALGSPPDPLDLGYYSIRAALGREALSQSQTWLRDTPADSAMCTR